MADSAPASKKLESLPGIHVSILNPQLERVHSLVEAHEPLFGVGLANAGLVGAVILGVRRGGVGDGIRMSIMVGYQRSVEPFLQFNKTALSDILVKVARYRLAYMPTYVEGVFSLGKHHLHPEAFKDQLARQLFPLHTGVVGVLALHAVIGP